MLIVGEGRETEPNYFRGLAREDEISKRLMVVVKEGRGGSPINVVKQARELQQDNEQDGTPFDEVWCVLDIEEMGRREQIEKAIAESRKHKITLCLSNPSFEVWFLAHFERTARAFLHSDAVITALDRHWQTQFQQDYEKTDARVYDRLNSRTQEAITNAQWVLEEHHRQTTSLDSNSSTEVYRLVRKLKGDNSP